MPRYTIGQDWTVDDVHDQYGIVLESATLHDTQANREYREGACRVRFIKTKPEGFRTKTWKGETAWSDARRYFNDAALKLQYGRP